ncbi:MAG: S-methyl-5'-thioadenosine phosphorylase [Deltaproteobacteria bacterium]|nr:S-methyl-5'-thioadenosine phosphorylase [Deltaproteobacteria bacterium]
MNGHKLGVIGGSGLYDLDELVDVERCQVDTPFGEPSGKYICGNLGEQELVFLPRHGEGHTLLPSEVNYRANIHGFRQLGVRHILSVSAVGSLREDVHPGEMVVPDQLFDRTRLRPNTFFGQGVVAHVSFGDPFCPQLRATLLEVLRELNLSHHDGGTYVCMEGPCFSTRAESEFYRSMGASVIGMTNLPEAKLAREAEICYATLALSTDYDCWHQSEEAVSVEAVLAVVRQNSAAARRVVAGLASRFRPQAGCKCQSALANAIMTDLGRIPMATRQRLALLLESYLGDS